MNARETERKYRREGRLEAMATYPVDGCSIEELREEFPWEEEDVDVLFQAICASDECARQMAGHATYDIQQCINDLDDDDERAEWLSDALYEAYDRGYAIGARIRARQLCDRRGRFIPR